MYIINESTIMRVVYYYEVCFFKHYNKIIRFEYYYNWKINARVESLTM